jgi:hypothetical protein
MSNEKKEERFNQALVLPGAIVGLVAGFVSIIKDAPWYVTIPLFLITVGLIVYKLVASKTEVIHDFEIVEQVMTIDIQDTDGHAANFTNFTILKATKNGAQEFDYYLYSDGTIEEIKTLTGVVTETNKEAGRIIVKTKVEKPMKKGWTIHHTLQAKYIDAFVKSNGFWQMAKSTPGADIKIEIYTPSQRSIKSYTAFRMIGNKKVQLMQQPEVKMKDGKSGISMNFEELEFLEKGRVEWNW